MTNDEVQQVPVSEAMRLAMGHHEAGRLQEAEMIYRAILDADPVHRGASYHLALIALQTGRAKEALSALKAAMEADPTNAAVLMNYAVALVGSGDPGSARSTLLQARQRGFSGQAFDKLFAQVERVIGSRSVGRHQSSSEDRARDPSPAELSSLAKLYEQGKHDELETLTARLMERFPSSARVLHLLGASRLTRNLTREANETLERARQLSPDDPEILNLLGVASFRLGHHEQARLMFEQSLARDAGRYDTLVNASANARAAGDTVVARRYAEQALTLRPNGVEAIFSLGNAASASGRNDEAVELYRRAIALDSSFADLYMNLGNVLTSMGKPGEAAIALQQALSLLPDYAPLHLNLGRALHDLGETAAAQRHFRAASDLDSSLVEAHSSYLFSLVHDETISPQQSFEEHLRIGELIEAPLRHTWREHENDRDPERDLRIGFVSGDLHDHPVANLIEPIWIEMKGMRHRIHVYSNRFSDDAVAARLRALADDWVQVERMSDEALCERIRADRIDILFDLSGHTARNRLLVFARKPAPIQVSWIGYPGTTGLSAMDYRFVRGLDSRGNNFEALFCEKLVRFGFRGFRPAQDSPQINRLPALSSGFVTFGSFNRPSKLGERVIAQWSRVLLAIPNSRLLIAGVGDARTEDRLRASFHAQGITPERLEFRPRVPLPEYLAFHHEVDIGLDTFPYSGGTTTSHALWMGVPVLTVAGPSLQQNHAASILATVGLFDWIVESEDAFVGRAVAAAADLPTLDLLRSSMRERAVRYFEGSQNEGGPELDAAFKTMWRRWCSGQAPESFTVAT